MSAREPVTDWETDFDHFDPTYVANPYPVWDELREKCPVAHSERFGSMWVPTRQAEIHQVAYDTDHFSSRGAVVINAPFPPEMIQEGGFAPPITSDPPFHTGFRQMLLPAFSPKRIAEWDPLLRTMANELIDDFIDDKQCDVAKQYSKHIPVTVIALMVGASPDDRAQFTEWIHYTLEVMPTDPETAMPHLLGMSQYLFNLIEARRKEPEDDLVTYLLNADIDGEPLDSMQILGAMILLVVAGIDTTWSSIGASIWHLAQNPDDLSRLVNEPDLMVTAVEEFLRAYAPVTMAREVVKDVELAGCPLKAGDRLLLPFPSANRDPEAFPDPDKVVLDRKVNRHHAFGAGIHRCLGSNLARLELRIAIEEFIRRIPEFHLADPKAVAWSSGQVRGPRSLPIVFDKINA